MKNTTFFALLLLVSYTLFAQKRILIPGKLLYKNTDLVAANVINNTAQMATITDASGEFEIEMKEGDVLLTQKFQGEGPYARLALWMQENASQFGFYLPYTNNKKRKGFSFEPWHYSYAPVSIQMLKAYLKLDLISFLKASEVLGKEVFDIDFISTYIEENVKGINPVLL